MKSRTWLIAAVGLVITLVLLVGCDGGIGDGIPTTEGGGQTTTTGEEAATTTTEEAATTTSEAPDTTATSGETDTTAAPDTEEEAFTTRQYVLIGIIALAFIIIVIIAVRLARGGKKDEASADAPAWRANQEQAYSQSRWLYENLTPEIAQWRGDSLPKSGQPSADAFPDTTFTEQETWSQLGTQMTAAVTALYSLETQVDPSSQPVVRSVIDSLNNTRTAVDEVASARLAVNQATAAYQKDSGNQRLQQELSAAHQRENLSVQNLNGSRTVLYGALANLAALR
jgi:hypothetical protein